MLQIKDLPSKTIDNIKRCRYDSIIEKHEGPGQWEAVLKYFNPDFIEIDKKFILLPVDSKYHKNITLLRTIIDKEEEIITLFLKDTTYVERPEDEFTDAGFIAICEKIPGEIFYIAIVYHEWFIIKESFCGV
jgi:hypothetical protein